MDEDTMRGQSAGGDKKDSGLHGFAVQTPSDQRQLFLGRSFDLCLWRRWIRTSALSVSATLRRYCGRMAGRSWKGMKSMI